MFNFYFLLVTSIMAVAHGQTCSPGTELVATVCVDCPSGKYKDAQMTTCEKCPIGFYQPAGGAADCVACSSQFITATTGSTNSGQCSVANCPVGYFRDLTSNTCQICPIGTYQDTKWKDGACISCSGSRTTASTGSTSISQCLLSCPLGKEDRGESLCEHCMVGYYKASVGPVRCVACPSGFSTPGTGATDSSLCNTVTCNAGHYINTVSNQCEPCPLGSYQGFQDQTTCLACPVVSGVQLTTLQEGSTNVNQCLQYCPDGQEYSTTSGSCQLCLVGQYRTAGSQEGCVACPTGLSTASTGATTASECTIDVCPGGKEYSTATSSCQFCPVGKYRTAGSQGGCVTCPTGFTTAGTGAAASSQCNIQDCPSGQEYSSTTNSCQYCPQGEYRTAGSQAVCVACPSGLTTASTGVTAVSGCSIVACLPGSFRVAQTNQCQQCPKNSYQPDKWKTSCYDCPSGRETASTGTVSGSGCLPVAAAGACASNPCLNGGVCYNTTGVAVCVCAIGYQGNLCQNPTPTTQATQNNVGGAETTTTDISTTTTIAANVTAAEEYDRMLPYILGGSIAGVVLIAALILFGACLCSRSGTSYYDDDKSQALTDYSLSSRAEDHSDMYNGRPFTLMDNVYRTGHVPSRQTHLPREGENRLPISDYPQTYYHRQPPAVIAYAQPSQPAYNSYNWQQSSNRASSGRQQYDYSSSRPVVPSKKSETSSEFLFYEETDTGAKIGKGLAGYDLSV